MHDRRWEYKVETVKPSLFSSAEKQEELVQDRLTRLGVEGWELVSVGMIGHYRQLFLKR
jgi:hypothetical protein